MPTASVGPFLHTLLGQQKSMASGGTRTAGSVLAHNRRSEQKVNDPILTNHHNTQRIITLTNRQLRVFLGCFLWFFMAFIGGLVCQERTKLSPCPTYYKS